MKILAIDTSCDDTSVAISENQKILSNEFWSKLKLHSEWGGVVPSEAKRQHEEFLPLVIEKALTDAGISIEDIDAIAVTYGPGLAIALEPGIAKAKELAEKYDKPLIAVNHMIGHIYANLAQDIEEKSLSLVDEFKFPALALTISGGHTDLYLMEGHFKFEHIGQTLDDSIGEAFDKVGRTLGFGFPAGKAMEDNALKGNDSAFNFPRPLSNTSDYNWSYSGLKTAVLYQIKKLTGEYHSKPGKGNYKMEDLASSLTDSQIADIAASFQKAAVDALIIKLRKAIKNIKPKMFVVGGGVIANTLLRTELEKLVAENDIEITYPKPMWLCTDNAAMIAVTAYYMTKILEDKAYHNDLESLDRVPNLEI